MDHDSRRVVVFLALLFLCGTPLRSHAQRILNPGESWSWQIVFATNWGGMFTSTTPPVGGVANAHFLAYLHASTPVGTVLRCEVFEGQYFGGPGPVPPVSTLLYTSAPPNTISNWVSGAMQDLEGSIRFTALNNPVILSQVSLGVDKPSFTFGRWDHMTLGVSPPAALPQLYISSTSNSVQLRWWTNVSSGYVLESTNVVTGASWSAVATAPVISNGQKFVTLSTTNAANRFFRLLK